MFDYGNIVLQKQVFLNVLQINYDWLANRTGGLTREKHANNDDDDDDGPPYSYRKTKRYLL